MARRFVFALLLAAAHCARGAEAEYKIVRVEADEHSVNVRLPLTDVTGKVRVKTRAADGVGTPVSPLHTKLGEHEYLEWQIGYDSLDAHHPSVANGVVFQRKGETKYGIEFSKILAEAHRLGFVTNEQLRHEREFLQKVRTASLEETAKIDVEKAAAKLPDDFEESFERVPRFTKETPDGRIEIELKPKQRAVGLQAMVYVCLNMSGVRSADGALRPMGAAHSKETVFYRFTNDNVSFLFDIIRAFGIASRQHNEDMTHILDCLLALN